MFSLVLATYDNLSFLKKCLKVPILDPLIEEIIVVDNSINSDSILYLNSLKSSKIKIIKNKRNNGVIRSRNQGLSVAKSKFIMVIDDDQSISSDTMEKYKSYLERYDIVGCDPQIMDLKTGLTKPGSLKDFNYVGAGGMAMSAELWRHLGLFDEVYQPAYFEDPDLVIRAKREGKTVGVVLDSGIIHYPHQTLCRRGLGFDPSRIMIRNRKIFLSKYGIKNNEPIVSNDIKFKDRKPRLMYVLNDINIGGVQLNSFLLLEKLRKKYDVAVYVSESSNKGHLQKYLLDCVDKIYYNNSIKKGEVSIHINVSHKPQVLLKAGSKRVVPPGGDIRSDEGYFLNPRVFRKIKTVANTNTSIIDVFKEYAPDIIHYHRDVSRISRDVKKLRECGFKVKVVRTVHGRQVPNLSNYDCVVLPTNANMKIAKARYKGVSLYYIPHGINSSVFKPIEGVKKENIIITHTRLSKILKLTSHPSLYFDIVNRVTSEIDVKFVLVGPDYDIYKERFDKWIKEYNVSDKLIIKPPLYFEELNKEINKAKIWFYPSNEDNFPLSVLEAMACKLPIVTSNIPGIMEMVTNEVNGLIVRSDDVEGYVKALVRLFNDNELANDLADRAYSKAMEEYSLEAMVRKYDMMYQELLKG